MPQEHLPQIAGKSSLFMDHLVADSFVLCLCCMCCLCAVFQAKKMPLILCSFIIICTTGPPHSPNNLFAAQKWLIRSLVLHARMASSSQNKIRTSCLFECELHTVMQLCQYVYVL